MESLSIKIQKLMLEKGLNKKTTAERCGWTPSAFANKLKRDSWNQEDLQKLANALNTTIVVEYTPEPNNETYNEGE